MKLRTVMMTSAVLAALGGPAFAGDGFYLGLQAGVAFPKSPSWSADGQGTAGRFDFWNSPILGGSAGYKWPMGIRTEAEITHPWLDAKRVVADHVPYDVHPDSVMTFTTFMLNGAYDFPIFEQLLFTVGAGVGAGVKQPHITVPCCAKFGGSDASFTWQLMAGLVYEWSPNLNLQLDYRFRSAAGSDGHFFYGAATPLTMGKVENHAIMVGVRWFFEPPI